MKRGDKVDVVKAGHSIATMCWPAIRLGINMGNAGVGVLREHAPEGDERTAQENILRNAAATLSAAIVGIAVATTVPGNPALQRAISAVAMGDIQDKARDFAASVAAAGLDAELRNLTKEDGQ